MLSHVCLGEREKDPLLSSVKTEGEYYLNLNSSLKEFADHTDYLCDRSAFNLLEQNCLKLCNGILLAPKKAMVGSA